MQDEELRETRLLLSRSREREKRARLELDAVVRGLGLLVSARSPRSIFQAVLSAAREVVEAEHAALVFEDGDVFPVHTSTLEPLENVVFEPGSVFRRVLGGKTVPAFDVSRLPEWSAHSLPNVVSVLHAPVLTDSRKGLLLLTHSARGFFTRDHVSRLQILQPLVSQAVLNADALESDERRVERELRDLARFPKENPMPVLRVRDGEVVFANPAADGLMKALGLSVGQTIEPALLETLMTDSSVSLGKTTYALLASEAVPGDTNIYAFDISARIAAERALRSSRAQLRAVIDSSDDPIFSVSSSGQLETYNFAFGQLMRATGLDPEEQMPLDKLPESQSISKTLPDVLAGGSTNVEWELANDRTFELQVSPTRSASSIIGATVVARDVSARVEAARALQAARQEAERANAAKSTFLAQMSHEIRTPLNAILGMNELARHTAGDEQLEMLDRVRVNGEALLHLVSDLLDVSKIEAGQFDMETRPFRPDHVVQQVCAYLKHRAEQKGLALVLEVPPSSERLGDGARFRQIVTNLVGNAIKYTESGEVRVVLRDGDVLELSVSDTGIGIPEAEQDRVFSRFYRAHRPSRSRVATGTGLGLSITQSLIEMMGGTIALQSVVQQGSTFDVRLPLERASAQQQTPKQPSTLPRLFRTADVLVVDDNPDNLAVTSRYLSKFGHRPTEALGGIAGVQAALSRRFDVVLMDIDMPDLDGLEAAVRIRNEEVLQEWPTVPIVALTAHATEEVRRRCITVGMDDFLSKPTDAGLLNQTLRAVADLAPHVLVVDDARDSRALFERWLTDAGAEVTVAESGRKALEALGEETFDAVFTDLDMPGVDGWKVLEAAGSLPKAILSGHGDASIVERAHATGAIHLLKPVDRATLVRAAARLLGAEPETTPPATTALDPDVAELVPMFIEGQLQQLAKVEKLIGREKWDKIRRLGHTLKGTAPSFGFEGVGKLGKSLEDAARSKDVDAIRALVDAIQSELR